MYIVQSKQWSNILPTKHKRTNRLLDHEGDAWGSIEVVRGCACDVEDLMVEIQPQTYVGRSITVRHTLKRDLLATLRERVKAARIKAARVKGSES